MKPGYEARLWFVYILSRDFRVVGECPTAPGFTILQTSQNTPNWDERSVGNSYFLAVIQIINVRSQPILYVQQWVWFPSFVLEFWSFALAQRKVARDNKVIFLLYLGPPGVGAF